MTVLLFFGFCEVWQRNEWGVYYYWDFVDAYEDESMNRAELKSDWMREESLWN